MENAVVGKQENWIQDMNEKSQKSTQKKWTLENEI